MTERRLVGKDVVVRDRRGRIVGTLDEIQKRPSWDVRRSKDWKHLAGQTKPKRRKRTKK